MRLHVFGARGSTPVSGSRYDRYGGNTPCVAVSIGDERPSLVIDAGSGIREVTALCGDPFNGTILLSHLHWDHVQGLPFFAAADREGSRVQLLLPEQGEDPEALVERILSPPFFPIRPGQLRGDWRFGAIGEGPLTVEGFKVEVREVPHKGARTFGFRVSHGSKSFAYISDHNAAANSPSGDPVSFHEGALELARSVDVLFHDAQYTTEEFKDKVGFGHSSVNYAVEFAERAHVKRLLLFHHDPSHTDDEIDELVKEHAGAAIDVGAAAQGDVIEVRSAF